VPPAGSTSAPSTERSTARRRTWPGSGAGPSGRSVPSRWESSPSGSRRSAGSWTTSRCTGCTSASSASSLSRASPSTPAC